MFYRKITEDGLLGDIRSNEDFLVNIEKFEAAYQISGDAKNFVADRRDDYKGSDVNEEEKYNKTFPRQIVLVKDKSQFWSVTDSGLKEQPVFLEKIGSWILNQLKEAQTNSGWEPHPWLFEN